MKKNDWDIAAKEGGGEKRMAKVHGVRGSMYCIDALA